MALTLPPPPNNIPQVDPETGFTTQVWARWNNILYQNQSGTFAPQSARYVINTASTDLQNAQVLASLSSGFVKVTTGTGILSSTANTLIQTSDLSVTGVVAGAYGSAEVSARLTVGDDGRITTISNIPIVGTPPGGTAGGGLSGTYPDPTVISVAAVTTGTLAVANGGTGITSLGTGIATFLGTPSSANLAAAVTDETGSGLLVFATSPTFTTPLLGTPTSGTLTNCTGLPEAGLTLADNTTNNSSTSNHGFLKKLDNSATNFMNGQGNWAAPTVSSAALTRTDDTNVTLTLGGSPTTALLNAASLTLGWTGQLGLTRGGTAASLTASNGGIVYSGASALAILSGTATASKMLLSGSSTTPTWSTSTIPTSAGATANKVLLSDGTNYILSTPTFPNASATSRKIIVSDGTNWVASTETYADPGTSGNVLTSNGTNWTSATPSSSGTVNSGTAGQLAYYATSTNAVSTFNPPSFSAYDNAGTTIAANGYTKVNFDTEYWDSANYYSTTNKRFTPLIAGTYQIQAGLYFQPPLNTLVYIAIYKNGTLYKIGRISQIVGAATYEGAIIATLVQLNGSTDYVEIFMYNGAAATTYSTGNGNGGSYFDGVWVSA